MSTGSVTVNTALKNLILSPTLTPAFSAFEPGATSATTVQRPSGSAAGTRELSRRFWPDIRDSTTVTRLLAAAASSVCCIASSSTMPMPPSLMTSSAMSSAPGGLTTVCVMGFGPLRSSVNTSSALPSLSVSIWVVVMEAAGIRALLAAARAPRCRRKEGVFIDAAPRVGARPLAARGRTVTQAELACSVAISCSAELRARRKVVRVRLCRTSSRGNPAVGTRRADSKASRRCSWLSGSDQFW
mmetsp:Transcript_4031/g.10102  ORF Transcript_4031/g.10102 Transcript_4031/m.10102 type:complete len:243 (+) Transcript_4031:199-927(+)